MAKKSYTVFAPAEVKMLEALSLTFFPPKNSIGLDGVETEVPQYLDDYFSRFPWIVQVGFRIFLRVMNWLPILLLQSGRTFRKMEKEKREKFLLLWYHGRFYLQRLSFLGFKLIFCMAYFNHPEVLKRIEFYDSCPPHEAKS
ncbi:MAG: hypothetical protein NT009_08060 [Proteobacteria bacterium]|nr:hypothetical protein [Pseudomonadota bacterium]